MVKAKFMMRASLFFLLFAPYAFADTVRVAVAANFAAPLKDLALGFERKTGHRVQVISGSSGKLYAQIIQGAPFDLFLSADTIKPLALVEQGKACSVFTYAQGQLVVFVSKRILPQASMLAFKAWLNSAAPKRIAIANPSVAPYGQAAQALLCNWLADTGHMTHVNHGDLGCHTASHIKLIHAENISQVAHYVKSGSVDVGFMAASLLPFKAVESNSKMHQSTEPNWQRVTGGWLLWLPAKSYKEIIQQGVILPSAKQLAAQALSDYLLSDEVQLHLQHKWYYLPMAKVLKTSPPPVQSIPAQPKPLTLKLLSNILNNTAKEAVYAGN